MMKDWTSWGCQIRTPSVAQATNEGSSAEVAGNQHPSMRKLKPQQATLQRYRAPSAANLK